MNKKEEFPGLMQSGTEKICHWSTVYADAGALDELQSKNKSMDIAYKLRLQVALTQRGNWEG